MTEPSAAAPRVSVIVPAYRAAQTVGATISSVLSQTYSDLEIIVVDDGSDDETSGICHAHGNLVRYVRQENAGVSAARNHGARLARGELLLFLDSDDLLLPPALEEMLRIWDDAGGGRRLVTCNAYPLTIEGIDPGRRLVLDRFPAPNAQRLAILRTNIVCGISLVPAGILDELGGYDENVRVAEDWDLWLRAVYAGVAILYQRRPLALYRWLRESLSSDGERLMAAEDAMFERFESTHAADLSTRERELLTARLRAGSPWRMRTAAAAALESGDVAYAASLYRRAARLVRHDRRMHVRAWSLTLLPWTARWWRARDARIDASTGLSETGPNATAHRGAS